MAELSVAVEDSKGKDVLTIEYEDEVHLRAIRKALASGNAAVMVGSGFSRNAEGGSNVGTWDDLAKALAKGLTTVAEEPASGNFNAANATQLAEQYERLLSRPALEQLLKEIIPDERLSPGRLHGSLLALPWSEVFTTNYDTLLERAADRLVDAKYITICCREDIPQSKVLGRRRIVKLHGSFASHRPFVVTEEDYRTYPQTFAPFVNLVRQALLENVLCLIGFSGDDPNFLHWIGWVRDMLDRHALPVYLFLSRPPSLGQRRLLQARGVTPVVLPPSVNGEASDYAGRYQRLFDELTKPFEGDPEQWGAIVWKEDARSVGGDATTEYPRLQLAIQLLSQCRSKYPGWLVAPARVRSRFEIAVRTLINRYSDALQLLESDSPSYTLAALEHYSWFQSILLGELLDDVAELALKTLESSRALSFSKLSDTELVRLEGLGIRSQNDLVNSWTNLAIAVLAWARQGHRKGQYEFVGKLLREIRPEDPSVHDHLQYQEVLNRICRGDRGEARFRLAKWKVRGRDPYMEVRRAMLVAELGDEVSALSACERAILALRQQQRHKPDDPLLLSMESWACYVSGLLSRSLEHTERLRGFGLHGDHDEFTSTSESEFDGGREPRANEQLDAPMRTGRAPIDAHSEVVERRQQFDKRLKTIGIKGYASNDVLDNVVSALTVDAGRTDSTTHRNYGFELGSITRKTWTFGHHGKKEKLQGSMAWLQLSERVGLIPSSAGANFYVNEFLQAAWWTRHYDPLIRGIGLLIRSMSEDALKPRDDALPLHQTGWLSRFEVARLPAEYALDQAEILLKQIESNFLQERRLKRTRNSLAFLSNVFGRLVVRVEDEARIFQWGQRLISLHNSRAVQGAPDAWGSLTRSLARCISALRTELQRELLVAALELPVIPSGSNLRGDLLSDWVNTVILYNAYDGHKPEVALPKAKFKALTSNWIQRLSLDTSSSTVSEPELLVRRLFVADSLDLLDTQARQEVTRFIWKNWDGVSWPTIPGFYPAGTLRWPSPKGISQRRELLKWLLSQRLRPFASGGYMVLNITGLSLSWSIPGDRSHLEAMALLVDHNDLRLGDAATFVRQAHEWVSSEGDSLRVSVGKDASLRSAVIERLALLDHVLAGTLSILRRYQSKISRQAQDELLAIPNLAKGLNAPFLRLAFAATCANPGEEPQARFCSQLTAALTSSSDEHLGHAFAAVGWIIRKTDDSSSELARRVFRILIGIVAARRMPALQWALDILSGIDEAVWKRIGTLEQIYVVDTTLEQLRIETNYASRPAGTGIPDEAIPILRSKSLQVAFAIEDLGGASTPAAKNWVEDAKTDPLPELRLGCKRKGVQSNRQRKR